MGEVSFQPIVEYVDGKPVIKNKPAVRDSEGKIIPDPSWVDFLNRGKKGEFMDRHQSNITHDDIHDRFGYHKANATTGPLHQEIRQEFISLAMRMNRLLPDGRAKSTMYTNLETASMWANKAVAELAPVVNE